MIMLSSSSSAVVTFGSSAPGIVVVVKVVVIVVVDVCGIEDDVDDISGMVADSWSLWFFVIIFSWFSIASLCELFEDMVSNGF